MDIDAARIAEAAEELGTVEDLRRLGRVLTARDSAEDRAHLRLLIVRTQEEVAPGPPDELEATAVMVLASMRGASLVCGCGKAGPGPAVPLRPRSHD